MLVELYWHQGNCGRIKNFPDPRQFATLSLLFVRPFTRGRAQRRPITALARAIGHQHAPPPLQPRGDILT